MKSINLGQRCKLKLIDLVKILAYFFEANAFVKSQFDPNVIVVV